MDLRELAAFLRSRRDRVRPADVGLAAGLRRRVPGLRRSEVAQLAGTSARYYAALEQATGTQPSAHTLAALARALRLGIDERDHAYRLAGRAVPAHGGAASHVPPGALDLIEALATPAQVLTDLHVVLAQNRPAALLFGPADARSGPGASLIHRWFTDGAARRLLPEAEHDQHAGALVAELHDALARRAGDRDAEREALRVVAALVGESQEFAVRWHRPHRPVVPCRPQRQHVLHPSVGAVALERRSLVVEEGRQRLLWYAPVPGTDAAGRLDLLAVVGLHAFPGR